MKQFSHHDCSEELRQASLKATPARLGVLSILEKAKQPLDITTLTQYLKAENIHVDKVTVFRIINTLTKKGITIPIQLGEGKFRYEHSAQSDHHHFICENCHKIEDISDCNISKLEKQIQSKKGLKIKRHSLEFYGLCLNCQN